MGDNHTVFDLIAAGELDAASDADRAYAFRLVKLRQQWSAPDDSANDQQLCEAVLLALWKDRVQISCLVTRA